MQPALVGCIFCCANNPITLFISDPINYTIGIIREKQ